MFHGRLIFVALVLFLCARYANASECGVAHTVQEFLQLWNNSVIGPGSGSHACTLGLLTSDARMTGVVPDKDGKPRRLIETPQQFVDWYRQHSKEMFWEQTLHSTVDVYENVARVTRTYEVRDAANGPVKAMGIEDFELIRTDGEWKAFSMLWQDAAQGRRLPERYLPSKK